MKRFLVALMLIVLILPIAVLPSTLVFAKEPIKPQNQEPFVTITNSRVYKDDGSIYFATQFRFNEDKSYPYLNSEGEEFKLEYTEIIYTLKNLYKNNNIQYVYNESEPTKLIRIDKHFRNRTEMNNELGITGDEVYPPMEQEGDFFYTDYISRLDSYLKDGGREILELKYLTYASELFQIANPTIDRSEIRYRYCYGTDLKSITSNATTVLQIDKMYYHLFDNIKEDSEIILTQRVPNSTNWQVIALVGSVLIVLIGVVIVALKRRKNGK